MAGTAELVVEDGSAVIAKVNVYDDSTYLPLTGNNPGDQAFATDTDILYIWDGSAWQQAGAANSDDLTEGSTNLFFTNERVDDRVSALIVGGNNITSTYDDTAGTLTIDGQPGYTNSDVGTYLSTNGYDTATNIVASITDSAPGTLDTLNELAAALGDDPNFATTVSTNISTKLATADFTSTANTWIGTKNTDDLTEGSANLYFTDARADARITASDTDALSEGSTNLYYTQGRFDSAFATKISSDVTFGADVSADLVNATLLIQDDTIPNGTTYTIPSGKQVVVDSLDIIGDLDVLGTLATVSGGSLTQTTMKTQAITHTNGTNAINISSNGRVGINTTTMQSTFNIEGFDGNIARFSYPASVSELKILSPTVDVMRIDTGASDALAFAPAGTEHMRIDTSGNVGIGTSTPAYALDVTGDKNTWISRLYNTGSDSSAQGLLVRSDATSAHDTPVLGVYADGGYKMMVKSSGKVGIGTTSPERPLHVKGANAFVRIESTSASQNSQLDIKSTTATWSIGQNQVLASTGTLEFYNGSSSPVVIKTNGNVGIGINDPAYRLDVGGIGAIQQRLKSSGDTGYTQGALVIESSDYSSNPGNRGQGVYYYNVPNLRTWYTGTLYNNGNKFGFGYKQASGFQVDAADNANAIMTLDGDNSLLEVKKTSGTLSGGANRPGATIKLHHEAQWESGYGNNQEATTNDFLGSIEFSTGDNSTGEGVRAAIRATVDSYYNSNALVFETAIDAQAVAPTEKMRIRPDGRTRIGGTDAITSQLTLGNVSDPDKITIWSDRTNGARAERTKYLSKTVRPLYNPNQYFRLNLGAGSSGTGATVRYQATFSTGHAAGHGYCEGVATFYAHHSTSRQMSTGTSGNPHISYARMYGNGSYYGWTTYPDIRFYLCNATGNDPTSGAAIYIQTSGHGHHNSGTYDLICDIQLDLQVMNSDYNADPHLTAVGSSTPSDIGAQLGCTFLS